jgi:hypothetical protein
MAYIRLRDRINYHEPNFYSGRVAAFSKGRDTSQQPVRSRHIIAVDPSNVSYLHAAR